VSTPVGTVKVAAVQAAYTLMNQQASLDRAVDLLRQAAAAGAGIVVLPEVFIPGTPIWIDSQPIWDGDADWYALLVEQAVVVPGPATEALGAAARDAGVYLVIGVDEREPNGGTIYSTTLYFGPDGALLGKHRKLMPTGSERTVWGMGDGSTLPVIETPHGRMSGLICWENFMPLTRFYLYSQGVDIWIAPTLAGGDNWIAAMRHIALEGRFYVIGVNPCVHVDQMPAHFPHRDRVWRREQNADGWVEAGNSTSTPGPARRWCPLRHRIPPVSRVQRRSDMRRGPAVPPRRRGPDVRSTPSRRTHSRHSPRAAPPTTGPSSVSVRSWS
jgi:nitrilase